MEAKLEFLAFLAGTCQLLSGTHSHSVDLGLVLGSAHVLAEKAVMCPRVNLFRSPTQFPKSGPHTKCMKRDSAHSALKIGWGMVTRPFAKCFTLSRRLRNTQTNCLSRMRPLWGHNSDGKVESCHPYPLIGVGGSSQIFPRFGRT